MIKKILSFGLCLALVLSVMAPCVLVSADANYADYVPGDKPANVFSATGTNKFISNQRARSGQNIEVVTDVDANTFTFSTKPSTTSTATEWKLNGAWSRHTDWGVWNGFDFALNTNYIVSGIKVKNISETNVTPYFGVELMAYRSNGGRYSATRVNQVTATGDNWQEYSEVLKIGSLADFANFHLTVGLTRAESASTDDNGDTVPAKVEGARVLVDTSNMYFQKEITYDIKVSAVAENYVHAGEKFALKSEIVNQLDSKSSLNQAVTVTLLNEDRTQVIDPSLYTVTDGANGTKEITTSRELPIGNYVAFVKSNNYAGFQKGLPVEVRKPLIKDQADNLGNQTTITKTSGGDVLGVTSAPLVFTAATAPATGLTYNWYVLNEVRDTVVTAEGFTVTPSQDTTQATVTIDPVCLEGNYYIVAEAQAPGATTVIRKGLQFTVNKANDISNIAGKVESNTLTAGDVPTLIDLVELGGESAVTNADTTELARILKNGIDDENLPAGDGLKDALKEYVFRAAIVSLYNKNDNAVALYDADGRFIYDTELDLAAIDTAGVTLYSLFNDDVENRNNMTVAGRIAVQNALVARGSQAQPAPVSQLSSTPAPISAETGFATCGAFIDAVEEEILLKAIQYPSTLGTGYMTAILTSENLAAAGITATNYLALDDTSAANETIANGAPHTMTTLQDAFDAIEDPTTSGTPEEPEDTGSTGIFGGGSFSGGGISGGSDKENDEEKEEETPTSKPISSKEFTDLDKSHWAYTDIYFLKDLGAISGMTEEIFNPEGVVTREQFLKILIDAFKIPYAKQNLEFKDVTPDAWYEIYVQTGIANGIVTGEDADTFGIGKAITRQDVCVMLYRALGFEFSGSARPDFADVNEIPGYAIDAVSCLAEYAIVNGFDDNSFKGRATCTRAQAAKIISSAIGIVNTLEQ